MNPDVAADPLALTERIAALAERLVARNRALEAEVDDLRDHVEGLTTKLSAARAASLTHTPPEATPALDAERAAGLHDLDTQRLARLRAELDAYLRDIDARLAQPHAHGDQPQS